MRIKNLFSLLALTCLGYVCSGQTSTVRQSADVLRIVDRHDILTGGVEHMHTSIRSFWRKDLIRIALDKERQKKKQSKLEQFDIDYLFKDNQEWISRIVEEYGDQQEYSGTFEKIYVDTTKRLYTVREEGISNEVKNTEFDEHLYVNKKPLFKTFYKTPANFYELETESFYMKINPVLNLKLGKERGTDDVIFQNTRGFEIRGAVDEKVFFYTSLYENQQHFVNHIDRRIDQYGAIPGNGFYKTFDSSVSEKFNGYDFLNAIGYVGFNISKSIGLEFGHGNHFIGNGYNSLLLSDYAHNYFYLKFNTRFWKFHYQNIFAELSALGSADNGLTVNDLLPKKYMAAHYLSVNLRKNLSIGLFESVVYNREDHFEFQYLNPVIIYRSVEGFLDSPDNVIIGLNAKWNVYNQFQFYGQLVFDEFKFEKGEASGWWGNKNGYQFGAKYVNVLNIDHLDAQIEFNKVRPYTYAHRDTLPDFGNRTLASYSHYNQPLAHPLGANFAEFILKLNYVPIPKVALQLTMIASKYGADEENENWGSDILKSYESRVNDFGNVTGQGTNTSIRTFKMDASYQFYHNFYFDVHGLIRNQTSDSDELSLDTRYFGAGVRMNIHNQRLDY